jgi:phosphotransferase system enzyme I (PtsP)
VRRRYDTLNVSFLSFIRQIVARCDAHGTPVSFCGEDAGRPLEAVCFAAMGLKSLSMRPASIGPIKHVLRQVNLDAVAELINAAADRGEQSVRTDVAAYLADQGITP